MRLLLIAAILLVDVPVSAVPILPNEGAIIWSGSVALLDPYSPRSPGSGFSVPERFARLAGVIGPAMAFMLVLVACLASDDSRRDDRRRRPQHNSELRGTPSSA